MRNFLFLLPQSGLPLCNLYLFLERLKIPRFVLSENLESIILYGFSDASEKGFGAVTYVSVIKNNGDRHSQLLCSKSRVAPLKTFNPSQVRAISMPVTLQANKKGYKCLKNEPLSSNSILIFYHCIKLD
ncbi:uncharacterized protein TNCV_2455641 [Trichonephila clavipes]|nr:uncharacterized protein TNCV_2455641 [Trichonephila clavipes]